MKRKLGTRADMESQSMFRPFLCLILVSYRLWCMGISFPGCVEMESNILGIRKSQMMANLYLWPYVLRHYILLECQGRLRVRWL